MDVLLTFSHQRRRRILLLAAGGIAGYCAYRLYHHPAVARRRRKLARLVGTLFAVADAVTASAEAATLVSSDLNCFLRSDADEIPTCLRQLSKIARSDEFSGSLSRVSEVITIGILNGYRFGSNSKFTIADSNELESRTSSGFSNRFLDKIFSPAGSGFASVVAGSFARNLILGFYSRESNGGEAGGSGWQLASGSPPAMPGWVDVVCSGKCRELIGDCVQLFVSTAVAVYLDKTLHINAFEEFFSSITNPKHEPKVKDMLVAVCNGAVETLVKTSHQVLSNANSSSLENREQGVEQEGDSGSERAERSSADQKSNKVSSGWVDQVSTTLAVPSNRRFVLDVTGRVTFETVRSFLEFLLLKMYDCARRGTHAVREEVVERGLEVLRYISAKSMVIVTICLALCMHVFTTATRVLVPA